MMAFILLICALLAIRLCYEYQSKKRQHPTHAEVERLAEKTVEIAGRAALHASMEATRASHDRV